MQTKALICAAFCVSLFSFSCATRHCFLSGQTFLYRYSGNINRAGLKEPSGIAYHRERKTLFAVGDEGDICEMTTEGRVIRMRHIGDDEEGDLEGITVHTGTGLLYVAAEGKDTILEIDPESLSITREFPIDRTYEGRQLISPDGQGIEGIAFVPDETWSTFFITNQSFDLEDKDDPSIIMKVRVPLSSAGKEKQKATIVGYFSPGIIDISDICYEPNFDTLIALSDAENIIIELKRDGRFLNSQALPGKEQEGIAIDSEGNIYIAQDSGEIIKYVKNSAEGPDF